MVKVGDVLYKKDIDGSEYESVRNKLELSYDFKAEVYDIHNTTGYSLMIILGHSELYTGKNSTVRSNRGGDIIYIDKSRLEKQSETNYEIY